jgi:hypothetical protein
VLKTGGQPGLPQKTLFLRRRITREWLRHCHDTVGAQITHLENFLFASFANERFCPNFSSVFSLTVFFEAGWSDLGALPRFHLGFD